MKSLLKLPQTQKFLQGAYELRVEMLGALTNQAVRVFHGPTEGGPQFPWAVDFFAGHFWITRWEGSSGEDPSFLKACQDFYRSLFPQSSAVLMDRPKKGIPELPQQLWGKSPPKIQVFEEPFHFWIELLGSRHPGLFLDHAPLRQLLLKFCQGKRVLNAFSYTGSLSLAAVKGGAHQVVSVDLAKAANQWAIENFKLNGFHSSDHLFMTGDVFDLLKMFQRQHQLFDWVLMDPPSFSRSKRQTFSVHKNLDSLIQLSVNLLRPQGKLMVSINTQAMSEEKFEKECLRALEKSGRRFLILQRIELPWSFPLELGDSSHQRFLKGFLLKALD